MFIDFDHIYSHPEAYGEVIGAIIGVFGIMLGTFITIITSMIMRSFDIGRENRREIRMGLREKKQKEFRVKRQIYTEFLSKLSELENDLSENKYKGGMEELKKYWSNISIKLDLVAGEAVKKTRPNFEKSLFEFAKNKIDKTETDNKYENSRNEIISAIRTDMDLN